MMPVDIALKILTAIVVLVAIPCAFIFFRRPLDFLAAAEPMLVRTKTVNAAVSFSTFCQYERDYPGAGGLVGRNLDVIELAYTKRFLFMSLMSSSIFFGIMVFVAALARISEINVTPSFNDLFVEKTQSSWTIPGSVLAFAVSVLFYYGTILLSFTQKARLQCTIRRLANP